MQEKYSFFQTHTVKKKKKKSEFLETDSHNTVLLQLFDFGISLIYYGLYVCWKPFYLRRYLQLIFSVFAD